MGIIYLCILYRKQAYFVDLFVRVSNKVAIQMYKQLGYIIYRTVLEYYSGDPDEDAYGKSLCQIILNFFDEVDLVHCVLYIHQHLLSECLKYLLQICVKHVRVM